MKQLVLVICSFLFMHQSFASELVSSNTVTSGKLFRPNHLSSQKMTMQLKDYYFYWKSKYLRTFKKSNGTLLYYIEMQGLGPNGENSVSTSEAHGYGMLTFVQLAHFDVNARNIFDGFVNSYNTFRSTLNPYTMSWMIHKNFSNRYGSATDGDLDIAYALLLAHKKWGSQGGAHNYLSLAKNLIQKGIKVSDFTSSGRTNLGDWDQDNYNTRSSDWMASHFESFYTYTQDPFWKNAVQVVYQLTASIQKNHSPISGLMPDFVIDRNPRPAPFNYLDEGLVDYSWNACRYPLRMAIDYKLNNRLEALSSLSLSLRWLVQKTAGRPENIKAGYFLDGKPQVSYSSAAFTAPWIMAAATDAKYQTFVNRGWDLIMKQKYDYYSDSISLLALIYLSDLWKKP